MFWINLTHRFILLFSTIDGGLRWVAEYPWDLEVQKDRKRNKHSFTICSPVCKKGTTALLISNQERFIIEIGRVTLYWERQLPCNSKSEIILMGSSPVCVGMYGNCVGLFSRVGSLQIMLVLLLSRWQSSFDTHISIFKVPFLFYLPICYCKFPNKRSRAWKWNSRLDVLLDLIYQIVTPMVLHHIWKQLSEKSTLSED